MRSLVAKSGKVLRVLGMPALKEWQEMVLTPGLHMSFRRSARTLFRCAVVRFFPDANLSLMQT